MERDTVLSALVDVREAKAKWAAEITKFNTDVERVLIHLIREAARNYISAEDVARRSGLTVKRVRMLMRKAGLDPHRGKTLLADAAAKALRDNADVLGVHPDQIDLMSPLAYLPAGDDLRVDIREKAVKRVSEDEYLESAHQIRASLLMGLDVEEDSVPTTVTGEQVEWLAKWLAGEGFKK